MRFEERLKQIKENTPKMPCTYGDENDRKGFYYEVRDTDFNWLFQVIETHIKIIESSARIINDMEEDFNELKARNNT